MGKKVNVYLDAASLDLWNSLPTGYRSQIVREALFSADIPDDNRGEKLLIREKKREIEKIDSELSMLLQRKDALDLEINELESRIGTDTLDVKLEKKGGRDPYLERQFQELLVKEGKKLGGFAANFSPNKVRAMKQHVGKGLWMTYVQRPDFTRVELYIYRGRDKYDETHELFEYFLENRKEIEDAFEIELNWDDDPDKNACRIELTYPRFDLHDITCWDKYTLNMAADMNRLNSALEPFYSKL